MSRAVFEIEADLAQLRTELDSARRKNDDLGKGFELTQSRAQRLADEGLRSVAGVSRQLAQVLGDIADKSPGVAGALTTLGAGFAVFETFKISNELANAARDFIVLGESTENYKKRLELATQAQRDYVESARALVLEQSKAAAAIAQSNARAAQSRLQLVPGFVSEAGGAQAGLGGALAGLVDQRKQEIEAARATADAELKKAEDVIAEKKALEEGFTRFLTNNLRFALETETLYYDQRRALAQEFETRKEAIESQRVERERIANAKAAADRLAELAKYDAAVHAASEREFARTAAVRTEITATAEAAVSAQRASGLAAIDILAAQADAAERAARAQFDRGGIAAAIQAQQQIATTAVRAGTSDRIAALIVERDKSINTWEEATRTGAVKAAEFADLRANKEAETASRITEIQRKETADITRIEAEASERRNALREQEIARVLAQTAAVRNAIVAAEGAAADVLATALEGGGRSAEAAAVAGRQRLAALEATRASERAALVEQLRQRQIDEAAFSAVSIANEQRASAERIKIRQDEMKAIRGVMDRGADVELWLGIKDGVLGALKQLRQIQTAANEAAQNFAVLQKAGISLDDLWGDITKVGDGLAKKMREITDATKNPVVQRAAQALLGDLESGNLLPRIKDQGAGLKASTLGIDEFRTAVGLAREDTKALNAELASASTLFESTSTVVYVGQLTAADTASSTLANTVTDLDVAVGDVSQRMAEDIPVAVDISISKLRQLQLQMDVTAAKARNMQNALRDAAEAEA